jgi:protein-disulfide isomerase
MSPDKKMSKRQARREKRRKREQQQRVVILGIVIGVAFLLAFALIYPNLKPIGEIVTITPRAYSQVSGTALGNPDAKVTVDVWEDFQCPACRNYGNNTEPLVIQNYVDTGKVRYVFHQYPFIDDFASTKESDQSANASMCAAEQNHFWEFKEMLFANWNGENLGSYADRRLIAFAESMNLDMDAFKACFRENRYKEKIDQDYTAGEEMGVSSTPSIFVNKQMVHNAQGANYVPSYEDIAAAIDAALVGSGQ